MGTGATSDAHDRRRSGIALCLVAACGFGLMAIFATQAYDEGVGVTTLLATRFVLAAAVFWTIVGARLRRSPSAAVAATPRRVVLAALAIGAPATACRAARARRGRRAACPARRPRTAGRRGR